MQTAQQEFAGKAGSAAVAQPSPAAENAAGNYQDYKIIRRNGAVVAFEPSKISVAMTKAFLAVNGGQGAASARVRELVEQLTQNVVRALLRTLVSASSSSRSPSTSSRPPSSPGSCCPASVRRAARSSS